MCLLTPYCRSQVVAVPANQQRDPSLQCTRHLCVMLQERFTLPIRAATLSSPTGTGGKDFEKALEGLAAAAGDLRDAGFDENDGVFLEDARTEL